MAIIAIFQENEWDQLIHQIDYEEKQMLENIINPIKDKIINELRKFKSSHSFQVRKSSSDLQMALQNMEIKEQALFEQE